MKLSAYIKSMYGWVTLTLIFLAALASYVIGKFPTNLIISVIAASLLDIFIKKAFLKKNITIPQSAIITGLIIGSIAPVDASYIVGLIAVFVAILSKFVLRLNGSNIFNPAALGIFLALTIFGLTDQWWAAMTYNFSGYMIAMTFLLILANYKADKLRVSIPFLFVIAILFYASGFYNIPTLNLVTAIGFISTLPYFFGFVMISEPRTSPHNHGQQMAFGVFTAILSFLFAFFNVKYSLFIALLLANLAYAFYRMASTKAKE